MTTPNNIVVKEKSGLKKELAIIPGWAYVVAVIAFVCIASVFAWFVWPRQENAPPFPLQILVTLLPATFLAFLVLMIGYVNRDAGRRGMSRTLWTLIVMFVPNALGFILYFLLRNPIQTECPKCRTVVNREINYCPSCGYSFHPTCPHCKSPIRPGDAFCGKCGQRLGTEHPPQTGV
jgi:RNA polymerase subunit RPABC4/transcription elongation factor Spt4